MKKSAAIHKHFQKVDQLTIRKQDYRKCVYDLCEWFLRYDQVSRDTTTKLLFPKTPKTITASIISKKEEIIVAGIEEACYLLDTFTDIDYTIKRKDGQKAGIKQTLLELNGNPAEILANERTILNILQRLSGIATYTNELVTKLKSLKLSQIPLIAATRKTPWMLLDKKAVALGGGGTHRLTLTDGVLVKDNHLLLLKEMYELQNEPGVVVKTLDLITQTAKDMLIEIEVEERGSIEALLKASSSIPNNNTLSILLDNFTPTDAKKTIETLRKQYDFSQIIFEASGGINGDNIVDWAPTGVDVISLGALTHSTRAVDISLEIK